MTSEGTFDAKASDGSSFIAVSCDILSNAGNATTFDVFGMEGKKIRN